MGLADKQLLAGRKFDSSSDLISALMKMVANSPKNSVPVNVVNQFDRNEFKKNIPRMFCPRCEKYDYHYAKDCPNPHKPYIPKNKDSPGN